MSKIVTRPTQNVTSKRFLQVSNHEDSENITIKIKLHGHKFTNEQFQICIENKNLLTVTAENTTAKKFERKFKLPNNSLLSKINSQLDDVVENTQTLFIHIPKEN